MDLTDRHIVHQNLHPVVAKMDKLWHPNSGLPWIQIDDPALGMHSIKVSEGKNMIWPYKYAKIPGLTEQGVTEMGKGGLEHLHWHKETQHYFVYRSVNPFR